MAFALVSRDCGVHAEERLKPVSFRQSNQVSKRDTGSAKVLEGVVLVYSIFLFDDQSVWTESDKSEATDKLRRSFDFITLQSRKHGKDVTFVEDYSKDLRASFRIPTDAHVDPKWTEHAIVSATHECGEKLVHRLRSETKPDSVIICLHVNKPALSYNLAYYERVARRYSAERMVCFSHYPDGRKTSAATYAHEILHLFGAGDLYFPYDADSIRKERASRLFPNDVMYRVDYDLTQLDVGLFTAYRVGWIGRLDPTLESFQD